MGERLDSNQQPEAYEAPALPLSYAPVGLPICDCQMPIEGKHSVGSLLFIRKLAIGIRQSEMQ
jgi:hypothetical protein